MLESIKFRGSCYLEKLCNLGVLSSPAIRLELLKNNGYISDMKRQTIVERIPCEFNLIDDGFILFGPFGSIYGKFDSIHVLEEKLIIYSNDKSYHLIFKDMEDLKKVKGLLNR